MKPSLPLVVALALGAGVCAWAIAPSLEEASTLRAGSKARVVHATAALRSGPKFLSSIVANAREGDELTVLAVQGAWVQARGAAGEGWVHSSALLDEGTYSTAITQGAGDVSYAERTAASRGFSPEIEEEYRADNPQIEVGFERLDAIERTSIPLDAVARFRAEGGLDR